MGLGNPTALWFLLLVGVLLLARKRKPRVSRAVANAYLWQQVAPQSAASFVARLRRHWLLLLQVAFVVTGTAALARPVLPLAGRRVAVVLDLSASMGARDGGTTRLDAAISRAIATIDALPRATRVRVIAARAVPEQLGDYGALDPALTRTIRSLRSTAGKADVQAAIQVARGNPDARPATVYVFSDALIELAGSGLPADVQWVGIGQPSANVAITNLAARRLPLRPADGQVLAEVWNYGATRVNAEIEVAHNGAIVRRHPVQVSPRTAATVVTDISALGGVVSARLTTGDAMDVDNVRFAVVPPVRPIRVLLVGGSFFVEKALTANRTLVVDRVPGGSVPHGLQEDAERSMARYDVIVCETCSELPAGDVGVLILPPASSRPVEPAPLTLSAPNHPIAASLDLAGVFAAPVRGPLSVDDQVVVARAAGQPALLASEPIDRRVVELRVDMAAGDLPLSAAFPVLVADTIEWLAARAENRRELVAGEPLEWMLRGPQLHQRTALIGPDGRPVPSSVTGRRLTSLSTHSAGVYVVRAGDSEDAFAVNPDTEGESDLTAAASLSAAAPSSPSFQAARAESPILTPLLLLALALLSGEWWFRCRAARRT